MLLGLTEPDAGEILYFGKDFKKHRRECLSKINFASTYSELQMRMTVYENLHVYGSLYDVKDLDKRISELLHLLEVEDHRNTKFWHLSSGQKTRVILAKSLLNRPRLLLMDEPTASLDPDIIHKIIKVIQQLQQKERISILFTSHNMEEVSRLCDRVAFMAKGKIIVTDTPLELTKKVGRTSLVLSFEGKQSVVKEYLDIQKFTYDFIRPGLVEIPLSDADIPKVLFGLKEKGVWITEITTEKPSLEDVFLHISVHQNI